jgi:hypothetical protein
MVWDAWDDDGVSDGMELIVAWPSDRVMLCLAENPFVHNPARHSLMACD